MMAEWRRPFIKNSTKIITPGRIQFSARTLSRAPRNYCDNLQTSFVYFHLLHFQRGARFLQLIFALSFSIVCCYELISFLYYAFCNIHYFISTKIFMKCLLNWNIIHCLFLWYFHFSLSRRICNCVIHLSNCSWCFDDQELCHLFHYELLLRKSHTCNSIDVLILMSVYHQMYNHAL